MVNQLEIRRYENLPQLLYVRFPVKSNELKCLGFHKTNVHQKNKKINISIDKLQISAGANTATAVFTQHYSSGHIKIFRQKEIGVKKNKRRMENIQRNYVTIISIVHKY